MRTLIRNAFRFDLLPEMLHKVIQRGHYGFEEAAEAGSWMRDQAQSMDEWARALDPALWEEAVSFADELTARGVPALDGLRSQGIDLGGGMPHELLYFLVRLRQPSLVLETGVAAGWSTTAVLTALEVNGSGHLLSSDLPYFRIEDPERYIGFLVPDHLKHRWTLETRGDRRNLRKLLRSRQPIDLVHYDSDKSRPGREWFARRIQPHLSGDAVVVWDDIHNNLHFRDHVQGKAYRVLERHGRTSGVVEPPGSMAPVPGRS